MIFVSFHVYAIMSMIMNRSPYAFEFASILQMSKNMLMLLQVIDGQHRLLSIGGFVAQDRNV